MAKNLSKSSKQFLSVLFHLAVLGCMVLLFDLVKPLIDKLNPGALISSKEEKKEPEKKVPSIQKESSGIQKESSGIQKESSDIQKESAATPVKPEKGGGKKKTTGGTTMADLMAQKKERQREKAEQQKKDE